VLAAVAASTQESPYIVTYDHHLEEPGSLTMQQWIERVEAHALAVVPATALA